MVISTARASRLLLWALALAPVLAACSARDLWAPDEPRYGQVAREMVASGDWLIPHANGAAYPEKPPLYWWGVSLLSLPGGSVNAVLARLGGALYAMGCVFLLARLVRRWFGDAALGLTAAALFSTTLMILWQAPRAGLDLPLTFWILLTVERGHAWLKSGSLGSAAACGAAWAGAVLMKGPLGFLFPPLAIAAMAWAGPRRPRRGNAGWWLIPALLIGLCLAWLLPAIESGGEAFTSRLLGQIGGRVSGAEGHHLRPAWYYLVRGTVWSVPWSLYLLAGVLTCLRLGQRPREDRAGLAACLAIGVGGFLLLSLIATKREVYLVPLLPFVAAAAAYGIQRAPPRGLLRLGRWLAVLGPALLGLGLILLPWLPTDLGALQLPPESTGLGAAAALLPAGFLLLWAANSVWRAKGDHAAGVRSAAPKLAYTVVVLAVFFLPRLDPYKSYAPAAEAAEHHAQGGPVYNAGFGQAANLLWSLDRRHTPTIHSAAELLEAVSKPAVVVASERWWDRLRLAHPELEATVREVWREDRRRRGLVVLKGTD